MSSIVFIRPGYVSNPSTNTSAELFAPKVEIPRIQNSEVFTPGCPDVCMARIPATLPAKAFERFAEGFDFRSSTFYSPLPLLSPVSFFCTPVPVMTTSSISLALASFIVIFTIRCCFISTSCYQIQYMKRAALEIFFNIYFVTSVNICDSFPSQPGLLRLHSHQSVVPYSHCYNSCNFYLFLRKNAYRNQ